MDVNLCEEIIQNNFMNKYYEHPPRCPGQREATSGVRDACLEA